jgi:hypothetical protein
LAVLILAEIFEKLGLPPKETFAVLLALVPVIIINYVQKFRDEGVAMP